MTPNLNQTLSWTKSLAATDSSEAAELAMLSDLQGNILKSHGRRFTINVFLKFDSQKSSSAKKFIASFAIGIGSALDQLVEAQLHKVTGNDAGPFSSLLLTAKGYSALGESIAAPNSEVFSEGMKVRSLGDPDPKLWHKPFSDDIHAMLLIGTSSETAGDVEMQRINTLLQATNGAITVVGTEKGIARFNKVDRNGIEHFGYVDGRSQPLALQEDVDNEQRNGGIDQWNPSIPLSQLLTPCPGGKLAVSHGSYFVFRKLEQNVRGFKEREKKLAQELALSSTDEERAGASVVGRFENGTPVTLSQSELPVTASGDAGIPNNFNFATDPAGLKCPFAGHIRKTNPRSDTQDSKNHLMARRGIPYGHRDDDPNDGNVDNKPTGGVGLLFMAYQSDIENQFEFTQRAWVNNPNFKLSSTGIDPLIGQPAGGTGQQWPVDYGKSLSEPIDFSGFVTMRGGEYFFSPSISYLKSLA